MGLPGFDGQADGGQAAVDEVGPVLDLLQPALDDADGVLVGRHDGPVAGERPFAPAPPR
jgi:hypothetical protein